MIAEQWWAQGGAEETVSEIVGTMRTAEPAVVFRSRTAAFPVAGEAGILAPALAWVHRQ